MWVLGSKLRSADCGASTLPTAISSDPRSYVEERPCLSLMCQILHVDQLFLIPMDHKEFLLPSWWILFNFFGNLPELRTLLETTCWLHLSPFSAWPEFETLKCDWILHFLQPWEALLFSLKNPFSLGLWPLQNSACELKCPPSGKKSCLHFPTSSALHMASELA